MSATVTTVIPAYQAARFIARALDSALAQEVVGHEILVVDDGSTDGTDEVVRSYAARGVRLIRHSCSRGASAARNTGIEAAHGEYVAFLDADDEWLPGKLQRQLEIITANPRMSFVSCRANLIDEHGLDTGDIYRGATLPPGPEAWRALMRQPLVATPSVLARREALRAVGGFNHLLKVAEDQDMWMRLALSGEVGVVPEMLVRVYSTPNSLSKASLHAQQEVVLPLIVTYVARNRHRLTAREADEILAARYAKAGLLTYAKGDLVYGVKCLATAMRHGYSPVAIVLFMLRASLVARMAKRVVWRIVKMFRPADRSRPAENAYSSR